MSVLAMRGVRLVRGGRAVLRDIHWEVRDGERWVVLGPNGAGKSSLLELASTYEVPSRGTVEVLGCRVGRTDLRELRRLIGYAGAPLARRIRHELTALEAVLTGPRAMLSTFRQTFDEAERAQAKRLLAELGLDALAEQQVGRLSEGERQRVQLARTLMTDPELLLLDEPTAGLDLAGREQLVARLARLAPHSRPARPAPFPTSRLARPAQPAPHSPPARSAPAPTSRPARAAQPIPASRPRAAVLVTHHLEEVPPGTTHALLLRDGAVAAAGPIAGTLTGPALSACFDVPLEVGRAGERWWARVRG